MKYRFNKIFTLLIQQKQNFFWRFELYEMLDIVPSCNLVQYQGKLMMQTLENGEKPNFGPPKFFS